MTHVIEVKRKWNNECYRDLDRIYELQARLPTVQCGLLVLLISIAGERDDLEKKVERVQGHVIEHMGECQHRFHRLDSSHQYHEEDGWVCTPLGVEVYGRS